MTTRTPLPPELVRLLDAVEDALEEPWSLERLADVAGTSRYHFHRTFREGVGETPAGLVTRLRLERAALLLLAGDRPITQLALEVGFGAPETFARRFRARFDVSARDYRRHQLATYERLGLEPGRDPAPNDDEIELRSLEPARLEVRRGFGEDEGFSFSDRAWPWSELPPEDASSPGRRCAILDWPGITEPGRVRLEWARPHGGGKPAPGWCVRLAPGGTYTTLAYSGTGPVPNVLYQRLFVHALAGRFRLRPGPIVELQERDRVVLCQPVHDTREV